MVQYPISNIQYPISNIYTKLKTYIQSIYLFLLPNKSKLSKPFSFFCLFSIFLIHLVLSSCAPISNDSNDPPAKSTVSLSTAAVVSSVQLEMSSSFAITKIGAIIRLAAETAPTKAQAEASAGYVSLAITANSPRKFSISQHYGSDFTDGLTLADVLGPNTQYKLYLFFEANAIPSETAVDGATLNNDRVALPFTTATLPAAGDALWNSAWTAKQFVGSLPEWGYSENQKGVFIVYTQIGLNVFVTTSFTTRKADDIRSQTIGSFGIGLSTPGAGFLFGLEKLGTGSSPIYTGYPDADKYYYLISADDTDKASGETLQLTVTHLAGSVNLRTPLTRY
ncbi:hypothetical protein P0082_07845 [Candidatus Haliotispira prima]|uniref:Uncharacterized protein n=1 Tax=Candidatus Haliotispira prima TaxID=3034016 RepID=A0ABY8MGT9_9SPIO|nr:hypothetical protein P0082_07845 [Candidatus Haliotispira prima]